MDLDAANIITDGENDFRLVVRGGGLGGKQYDAEIDLTKSQFDMLFPAVNIILPLLFKHLMQTS